MASFVAVRAGNAQPFHAGLQCAAHLGAQFFTQDLS